VWPCPGLAITTIACAREDGWAAGGKRRAARGRLGEECVNECQQETAETRAPQPPSCQLTGQLICASLSFSKNACRPAASSQLTFLMFEAYAGRQRPTAPQPLLGVRNACALALALVRARRRSECVCAV
jgi:hypothetical protein